MTSNLGIKVPVTAKPQKQVLDKGKSKTHQYKHTISSITSKQDGLIETKKHVAAVGPPNPTAYDAHAYNTDYFQLYLFV